MYFPISITIDQKENTLNIIIEKGVRAEFINFRSICSCGYLFKVPIVSRSGTAFTYQSLYKTNFSGEIKVDFEVHKFVDSHNIISILAGFEGKLEELKHIFEYSLYSYTHFFNLDYRYGYSCNYSEL